MGTYPNGFQPYYETPVPEIVATDCSKWPAEAYILIDANGKPHDIAIYTDSSARPPRTGLGGHSSSSKARNITLDSGAHKVTTSSLTLHLQRIATCDLTERHKDHSCHHSDMLGDTATMK